MLFWKTGNELKRRGDWLASQSFVVLSLKIRKSNEKGAEGLEPFFAALHGIYRDDPTVQEYLGFEIAAQKDSIVFYCFVPIQLRQFVEGQLYAQFPDLEIVQVPDYTPKAGLEGKHVAAAAMELTRADVYPLKTYASMESDPLAGITAVMAALEEGEHIWFQMLVRPVGDEWQARGVSYVKAIRDGKDTDAGKAGATLPFGKAGRFAVRLAKEAMSPGTGLEDSAAKAAEAPKLSAPQEAALKGIESKITKLGYESIFRLSVISSTEASARARLQSVLAAFKQFNTTNLNGFTANAVKSDDFPMWQKHLSREFEEKGSVLNIEELASVFHFPTNQVETSAISWSGGKKGEAPFNLPLAEQVPSNELTVLGKTDFRDRAQEFGIKMNDRKRHIYVIGKSGSGKSTLLENMIIDDVREGRGVILVDPHGELADKIVENIPQERIKDVIIIDPADRGFPVAFNPLEVTNDDYKGLIASGFVGVLKKIFGNSWGPRLEYFLRNTVLALLDTKYPTMLGIPRMLTEPAFREEVIPQIQDTVVRDFWTNEFAKLDEKQRTEAVGPILNKVGQFLSSSMIRNIVGQPESAVDFRKAMDEQKILIVNLSKGKIGEDNMALLGSMIITKVQLAAMSRADVAADQRPDSFLYVDEFQNFATESFATILSEARKYNLGLTIAHQYVAQMSEEVKDAVIGNVGTLISFRVGSPDASALEKEFAPVFGAEDMVNLQMARVYVKMLIDGVAAPAFSAQTNPPRDSIGENSRQAVVEYTHHRYSVPREQAEATIDETAGFRQKREAREASAKAAAALSQAGTEKGEAPARAVKRDLPADAAFAAAPATPQATGPGEPEKLKREPREDKPLQVIAGYAYREVSQKGGEEWHLGEKEADVLARRAARADGPAGSEPPPAPPSRAEQNPIAPAHVASAAVNLPSARDPLKYQEPPKRVQDAPAEEEPIVQEFTLHL